MAVKSMSGIGFRLPWAANIGDEWRDDPKLQNLAYLAGFALAAFILFIGTFESEVQRSNLFFIMLACTAIVWVIDAWGDRYFPGVKKNFPFRALGLGENPTVACIGLTAGLLLGLAASSKGYSLASPLSLVVSSAGVAGLGYAFTLFLYSVVCAPLIEEGLFRSALMPSLNATLIGIGLNSWAAWFSSVISSSFMFMLEHMAVYGIEYGANAPSMMMAAFIFGLVGGTGMMVFKTLLFPIGLHAAINEETFRHTVGYA
jgi:hypothetical protein